MHARGCEVWSGRGEGCIRIFGWFQLDLGGWGLESEKGERPQRQNSVGRPYKLLRISSHEGSEELVHDEGENDTTSAASDSTTWWMERGTIQDERKMEGKDVEDVQPEEVGARESSNMEDVDEACSSGTKEDSTIHTIPKWDLLPMDLEQRLLEDDWRYLAFQCFATMDGTDENQDETDLLRIQLEVPETEIRRIRNYCKHTSRKKKTVEASLFSHLLGKARYEDFRSKNEFVMWRRRLVEAILVFLDLHPLRTRMVKVKDCILREFETLKEIPINSEKYDSESIAFVEKIHMLLEAHGCGLKLPDPMRQKLYASLLSAAFPTWEEGIFCREHEKILHVVQESSETFGIEKFEDTSLLVAALVTHFFHTQEQGFLTEAAKRLEDMRQVLSDQDLLERTNGIFESLSTWALSISLDIYESNAIGGVEFDLLTIFISEPDARHLVCKIMQKQYRSAYERQKQLLREEWVEQHRLNPFLMLEEQIEEACKPNVQFFTRLGSTIKKLWDGNRVWTACLPSKDAWLQGCVVLMDSFTTDIRTWMSAGPGYSDILSGLKEIHGLQNSMKNLVGDPSILGKELWDLQPYLTIALTSWISAQTEQLLTWVDRLVTRESWVGQKQHSTAASLTDFLQSAEEMVDAFLKLDLIYPITMVRLLVEGIDNAAQLYAEAAAHPYSTIDLQVPIAHPRTRYKAKLHDQCLADVYLHREETERLLEKEIVLQDFLSNDTFCRANSVDHLKIGLVNMEDQLQGYWDQPGQVLLGQQGRDPLFERASKCCSSCTTKILSFIANQIVFKGLNFHIMQALYRGAVTLARAEKCFLPHIDKLLGDTCVNLCSRELQQEVAYRIIGAAVKAWESVVLDGGPERMFSIGDSLLLELDLQSLSDLFHANGEGLSRESTTKITVRAHEIVSMMSLSTAVLIENLEELLDNPNRSSSSPTSHPEVYVKILCHRKEHAASKYLKQRFNIPKAKGNSIFSKLSTMARTSPGSKSS